MKIVYTLLIFVGLALAAQATYAQPDAGPEVVQPAGDAVDPVEDAEANPIGQAMDVASALKAKKWREGMAGLIVLLMGLFARYRKKIPWVNTDRGGALTVVALGLLGGLVAALNMPGEITAMTVLGSMSIGITAAGFFNVMSKVLWPDDGDKQYLLWLKKFFKPEQA